MNGPIVTFPTTRMVGIELEFDAGNAAYHRPGSVPGWERVHDGSLRNGEEIRLTRPVPANEVYESLARLERELVRSKTVVSSRGGYHVHVGGGDLTISAALAIVHVYTHFQSALNALIGASRRDNPYAPVYEREPTQNELVHKFGLDRPADTRSAARMSRVYSVVNCAHVRCTDPQHRSVEFRQASPSKFSSCTGGWALLMTAFVELGVKISRGQHLDWRSKGANTVPGLVEFCSWLEAEVLPGLANLGEWVAWRAKIMTGMPENSSAKEKILQEYCHRARGLVSISRKLGLNYPQTRLIIASARAKGLIIPEGQRYVGVRTRDQVMDEIRICLEAAATPS